MTPPRRIEADCTYLLSRRVTQRKFLLRPSKRVDEAIVYCFAMAAKRYGVQVYWLSVMSNHYHAGVRDLLGNLPEFLRYLHSLLARCLNAYHGRWENFWSTEPSGVVELAGGEDIFHWQIYSLTNPVKDHLVDRVLNWPGVNSYRYQLAGKPMVAHRPRWFFDEGGDMPDEVELELVRPPEFAELTEEQWREKLRAAVAAEEQKAAAERAGRSQVLGRKAILRQSPFSCPKTCPERRRLRPRVASRSKWRRIERLRMNRVFQRRYREAYNRRRAGELDVVFPHGTYKLHVQGLVRCAAPPATKPPAPS